MQQQTRTFTIQGIEVKEYVYLDQRGNGRYGKLVWEVVGGPVVDLPYVHCYFDLLSANGLESARANLKVAFDMQVLPEVTNDAKKRIAVQKDWDALRTPESRSKYSIVRTGETPLQVAVKAEGDDGKFYGFIYHKCRSMFEAEHIQRLVDMANKGLAVESGKPG